MSGCAGFIVRYLAFVAVIGAAAWVAGQEWTAYGLEAIVPAEGDPRAGAIALGRVLFYAVLLIGPILAAIFEGAIRRAGVFVASFLSGVMVTAPFALMRALNA